MKKYKTDINLAFRFVVIVFVILLASGFLVAGVGIILYRLNWWPRMQNGPHMILLLFLILSVIIGTVMATIFSRYSFKSVNKILEAVARIGRGDFNVELEEIQSNSPLDIIAININQMAKELQRQEMMSIDFTNNFSHEFKTPIVSIQGFAKRLLTKELSEETRQEYFRIIYEESSRLSNLSKNTLYMSKLDNMELICEQSVFSFDEQIRQCTVMLKKEWKEKELEINLKLQPVNYLGNEEMLKQVTLNLLVNAIKFSKLKGHILISLEEHHEFVILAISDDGMGIEEKNLGRLFDKYYQGDDSRTTKGNGLGLSIVKKIVELSKGTIDVKSQLGIGTTFTICLPHNKN